VTLRPYQQAAIAAIEAAIARGRPTGLVAMPTGIGKTAMFLALARRLALPTLVLVHRDELTRQTVAAAETWWPEAKVGVVQAERDEWANGEDLVIASVQSLHERRRRRMPRDRFGLVITDEAHHGFATSYRAIYDHFTERRFHLGVTATPERGDGKGLAEIFGREPIYSYPLRQAILDGWLCRLRQYAIDTDIDLDGIKRVRGDFAEGALSREVNTPDRNQAVVEAYQEHAEGRRAVAFGVDVAHAEDLAEAFNDAGIKAACVTGDTPKEERRALIEAFREETGLNLIDDKSYRIMSGCMVFTEGWNDPGVACVVMARPTMSRPLYTQMVGRGLRLAPNKLDCIVLDITDNCRNHKLVTVMDLLGSVTGKSAHGEDVIEAVDRDHHEAEELDLAESSRPVEWTSREVSPWPDVPTLDGYAEAAFWHPAPASDPQVKYLRRFGLTVKRDLTKGEASWLIDRCMEFDAAYPSPATSKQEWFLKREGAWPGSLTKREASKLIGEIKARERAVPC